jgi:hypothetical protein
MLFVQFGTSPFDHDHDRDRGRPARKRHFDWFKTHNLRWETAAPRGWLEGAPSIFAVHFDGPDDPRVALYATEFEDGTGKSLNPDAYQMFRLQHASWLEKRRERDAKGESEEDDLQSDVIASTRTPPKAGNRSRSNAIQRQIGRRLHYDALSRGGRRRLLD